MLLALVAQSDEFPEAWAEPDSTVLKLPLITPSVPDDDVFERTVL